MKKLALLSLASGLSFFLMAGNGLPGKIKQTHLINNSAGKAASVHQATGLPQHANRSTTLQKVKVGSAGNLLTVLNSSCHQIAVDSVINTVLFIHRNDQSAQCCSGGNNNVAQYRYDWSKDGGNTYTTNVGVLNPTADNVTICSRYPQAMIERDPAQLVADSVYFVYDGTWHNGNTTISVWQGNYWGVAQLGGPSSTYTEARDVINSAKVEIFGSMTRSTQYHYWNITRSYVQTSATTATVDGIVIEEGVYNPATHATTWTSRVIPFTPAHFYDASGNPTGDALFDPTIAFDPTGQYGWILFQADLVEDNHFVMEPQLLSSNDYGATWSSVQTLHLDNLPGMFENTVADTNAVKTVMGDAQVTVDSVGNPHIAAIIGQCDSTAPTFGIYTVNTKNVLYDINYNPAATCPWQANYMARVFGYSNDYTVTSGSDAAVNDNNRVQISRTDDGKKIFIFWNDSDSSLVAPLTDPNNTNPHPNMLGIGIDISANVRKITDIKNFTAGDSLVGGAVPSLSQPNGALGGTMFNTVSQNVLVKSGGVYNIPVVVTEPDYRASVGAKSSGNPAQFYMCQNIEFSQSDFVNKFDNAPPTLTVAGPDTVYVQFGHPYTPPTATATDCVFGSITPTYTSTVHTSGGNTDSIGVFHSTWTATNPNNNSSTHTQVVIVSDVPIAVIYVHQITGNKFQFIDTSLNLPTLRSWTFGDGSSNNLNNPHPPVKSYSAAGTKMVILTVSNQYGSDKDTVLVNVTLGINDPAFAAAVNVYPNPSNGIVTIDMPSDANDEAQVTVFNTLGEVAGDPIAIKGNSTKTALNLNYLESGIYMLKVETASGKTALKQISITK
ncbi:MAG: hypothetical protein JWO03_306 [Bacteroidetes bacterium]|nr:hypothetical protein [Bacteroidota bacterium]